jgi:DNA uptake protein ComE-like DNA-binding protein
MQRLAQDLRTPESSGKTYDWLGDDWAYVPQTDAEADPRRWVVPLLSEGAGPARFAGQARISVTDEDRKLHLNSASKDQLFRLTGAEAIAQAIIDARDEPDPAEERPSDTPPYVAKNGSFVAPEELHDLPGMTREAYDTLLTHTSPYTEANEALNLNTVTPEVLRALGVSETAIQVITQFRDGPDGPEAHEQDGVFEEGGLSVLQTLKDRQGMDLTGTDDGNLLTTNAFGVSSQTFTVVSEGVVERPPVHVRVEAVVRRASCNEGQVPPCIIAWRES